MQAEVRFLVERLAAAVPTMYLASQPAMKSDIGAATRTHLGSEVGLVELCGEDCGEVRGAQPHVT